LKCPIEFSTTGLDRNRTFRTRALFRQKSCPFMSPKASQMPGWYVAWSSLSLLRTGSVG